MKRILYAIYFIKYLLTHDKGNYPVCYNEWLDNEYAEGYYFQELNMKYTDDISEDVLWAMHSLIVKKRRHNSKRQ